MVQRKMSGVMKRYLLGGITRRMNKNIRRKQMFLISSLREKFKIFKTQRTESGFGCETAGMEELGALRTLCLLSSQKENFLS